MAKFKTMQDAIHETMVYIKGRKDGTIKSIQTGYKKLDACMIDGMELNSTITIGGRPSVGKSAFSDCLVEGCFAHNRFDDGSPAINLLDFNWELSSRVTLLRRLSAKLKKSYKYIISADNNIITDEELQQIEEVLTEHYGTLPIIFSEEPESVENWGTTVENHLKLQKTPTLVRVDHTLLTKMLATDGSQVQMLLNLLMKANTLKKKYPVVFMFLTQMNRDFEDRQENGTEKAFPRQGDVYGGDAAAMFSETILLLNKPSKYGIDYYGRRPNGAMCGEHSLFVHAVKNRNATPDLILPFIENFKHMSIIEQ